MRPIITTILAAALSLMGLSAQAETTPEQQTVRIGFQKSSTLITVLKKQGRLDERLSKMGVKVEWAEFMSGPPLLEALNVGSIDVTADVADTVPVFAQAAGTQLVYFAMETASPTAQAIIIPEKSEIKTVAELKGKKIAVTKGTGGHYLLLATLASNGLAFKDITPAYLSPADGRAAFERGSVDAWVTWDPFFAAGEQQAGARLLADGSNGIAPYQRYYLASTKFAAAKPDLLRVIYEELAETGKWVKAHPQEAVALLEPVWGLKPAVIEKANSRRSYDVQPVAPDSMKTQQAIADAFLKEGILPKPVDTSLANVWRP